MTGEGNRARRLALNESLVREVNERIRQNAARLGITSHSDFLCECADESCADRTTLAIAEYERIRAHGGRFVVVPGHDLPDIEKRVAEGEGYVIVEKVGEPGEIAEDLDPRAE